MALFAWFYLFFVLFSSFSVKNEYRFRTAALLKWKQQQKNIAKCRHKQQNKCNSNQETSASKKVHKKDDVFNLSFGINLQAKRQTHTHPYTGRRRSRRRNVVCILHIFLSALGVLNNKKRFWLANEMNVNKEEKIFITAAMQLNLILTV